MLNLNNKLKVYFYLLSTSICFGQIEIIRAFTNLDFDQPVDLQSPNDNSNRLFIVEQEGEIYVFENFDSNTTTTQFLDIRDKVIYDGERGLLGLAFHPNYENNGYFFINYTAPNPLRTVIAKYEVSTIDSNIADEQSEIIILEIDQPYRNHNGGQIAFGPDGYLYIGMGDGGSGGDPLNHGQNLETLLGAMLRIDINNSNEEYNYSIPIDNPYINNNSGYREEIYAHGLRNPWRFSFDNITGDCWIADVGQNEYEEIDILEYAGNYGWRIMEGFHCFDPATDCDTSELILPIFEYDHNIGESITGGYVYRGTMLPSLIGYYIFADFEYGDVYSLDYNDLDSIDVNIIGNLGSYSVTSFGIDQNNEIYICDLSGEIYKLVDTTSLSVDGDLIPLTFRLHQNYPNPFNPITTLQYELPGDSFVNITVYDMLGNVVSNLVSANQSSGYKSVQWNATNNQGQSVSAGVYLYSIEAGVFRQTKKMVLLK
jgi:glucose/arabinose dehydrogenase